MRLVIVLLVSMLSVIACGFGAFCFHCGNTLAAGGGQEFRP